MTNAIRGVRQPIASQSVIGNPGSTPAAPTSIPLSALAQLLSPLIAASQSITRAVLARVPVGANPTATAGPVAVDGTATTFMRSDGAPAVQIATTGQKGLVEPDGTTIMIEDGVISAATPITDAISGLLVTGDTPGPVFIANDVGQPIYIPA